MAVGRVEDLPADIEPEHVLVLEENEGVGWPFVIDADLVHPIIRQHVVVVHPGAPGPVGVGDVVPQGDIGDPVELVAELVRLAGQRIAQAGILPGQVGIDLGALPAERVELEGAVPVRPVDRRLVDVAARFHAAGQRDPLYVVLVALAVELERGGAPRAQVLLGLEIELPTLRGDKVDVAGAAVALVEIDPREEVSERQLADHPRQLERKVEPLVRGPGEAGKALRSPERPRKTHRAGLGQLRVFDAAAELQRKIGRELAAVCQDAFVSVLRDAARSRGEGNTDELAGRVEVEQLGDAVIAVERRFARKLPIAAEHLPVVFRAGNVFAIDADAAIAPAGLR